MLEMFSEPIGQGRERVCYVHPDDPRLAIKLPHAETSEQTEREIRFYQKLRRRKAVHSKHIPTFHGVVDTSLGAGIVVDLIRDYDGQISRPMNWYLAEGYPVEEFEPMLKELYESFLDNRIIFNHDMNIGNLLLQKRSMTRGRLVAIDGLGDTVAVDWLDAIPWFARRKIRRRWLRFLERLYRTAEVRAQMEGRDMSTPLIARKT